MMSAWPGQDIAHTFALCSGDEMLNELFLCFCNELFSCPLCNFHIEVKMNQISAYPSRIKTVWPFFFQVNRKTKLKNGLRYSV